MESTRFMEKKLKKFFLIGLFLSVFMGLADASTLFEAEVHTDVTARTVTEAKQKAISKAIRQGLDEVILNISTDKAVVEINKLNDNQISHFITGVQVLKEQSSDVRYIADLKISVDEDILSAYLKENDLPIIHANMRDIVILPILEQKDGNIDVWGDENFWRAELLDKNLHKGLLNVRVMDKNLGNIGMVKANRPYDLRPQEYAELVSFNHADDLYVLKYSEKDNKIYVKGGIEQKEKTITINGESTDELIDKVLPLIYEEERESVTEESLSIAERIEVIYNYPNLAKWNNLRRILSENPQIQNLNIVSMANGKVHFNFQYNGVIEKLQGSLESLGYKMKSEGNYYAIN